MKSMTKSSSEPGRRNRENNSRERVGRRVATIFAALALSPGFPLAIARANSLNEYQVKAAFLFNFAKFIDWPEGTYSSPRAPFAICILGKDPFGSTLDEVLARKVMENHPVVVLRLKDGAEARNCQMVFVSSSETKNYGEIMEMLRGASVLVVGETDGFAASGGTIEFTLEEDHVRFTINPEAARRAGLKCSSRLLALAKIVHDGPINRKS
jgi:hypothetical protein